MDKNKFHGHPDFYKMTEEENKLHSEKNQDYARGGNPLGNFYRVSDMLKAMGADISPAQVGFIYMLKQLDAAGRMLFGGYEGKVENLDTRLQDVSVYSKLVRILHKEAKGG